MASQFRDARGHIRQSATPSTSTNLLGRFPDVQAVPHIAYPLWDHEVDGVLAETGPHDVTHPLEPDSPVQHTPEPAPRASLALSDPSTASREAPSHWPFFPQSYHATSTPQPFAPGPPPSLPAFVPAPGIPPAPAGFDPILWQTLILNPLSGLRALQLPPTTAPTPASPPPEEEEEDGDDDEVDAKVPTSFNGDDHTKLRDFLFECKLSFDMKPSMYSTEQSRVLYAIQHLDGMAKRNFRRYCEAGFTDPKVNRWDSFVQELETVFGDPDRIGSASDKILGLKMNEGSRVFRYTIPFRELADELGWPDVVLHRLYYKGLPNRIKDVWAASGPPPNFDDLVRASQLADNRYWQRVDEKKQSKSTLTHITDTKSQPNPSTSFDGDDPTKLRDFLFRCRLIFDMKPHVYSTEKSRVLYAIQHLDGMAKRHFRRYIETGSTDPMVNQWVSFVQELDTVFGDPNRIGRALDNILGLKMKKTGRVHHYTVLFGEFADELGWPDPVLRHIYYKGLPNRIINDLWAISVPPPNFDDLVREAQRADNRYWERVDNKN